MLATVVVVEEEEEVMLLARPATPRTLPFSGTSK
jgi:hypothetical protein